MLRSLILQIAAHPTRSNLIIVDGKGEYDYVNIIDQSAFVSDFADVLLGHEHAPEVLSWLVEKEIVERRNQLREYFTERPTAPRSPKQAFVSAQQDDGNFPLVPLVVVIDEFAEIMLASGKNARVFEDLVQRVVQAGRSAWVHLLLATQRPDSNVLKGAIKANLPSRVALTLPSHHDSMTVLSESGAEDLLGKGDMIYISNKGERIRLQGFSV